MPFWGTQNNSLRTVLRCYNTNQMVQTFPDRSGHAGRPRSWAYYHPFVILQKVSRAAVSLPAPLSSSGQGECVDGSKLLRSGVCRGAPDPARQGGQLRPDRGPAGPSGRRRTVGWALNALRGSDIADVPWQRVINSRGRISISRADLGATLQRAAGRRGRRIRRSRRRRPAPIRLGRNGRRRLPVASLAGIRFAHWQQMFYTVRTISDGVDACERSPSPWRRWRRC